MYTHCHLCHRGLGTNDSIPTMPVGRKLAYDIERGRLWIVCRRCDEWNLTPVEERWEAIETCERLFASSSVRVSSTNVGLARAEDVELVRIGHSVRDELANWRYGPRLSRRRRRTAILTTGAGVVAGGALGGALLAGIIASRIGFAVWGIATAGSLIWHWGGVIGRRVGPFRDARIVTPTGEIRRLRNASLPAVRLVRQWAGQSLQSVSVSIPNGTLEIIMRGADALVMLGELLPRLNWQGATPRQLDRATGIVDRAEEWVDGRERSGSAPVAAWQRVVNEHWPRSGALAAMHTIPRIALEMAVTEELERLAMAGDAALLSSHWLNAEEIAKIADDMFLPPWMTDWLERHRRSSRDGPEQVDPT